MLRDNLAGLIEPMIDCAGVHSLSGHHKAGQTGGMLQVHRVGNRRSEAILAPNFSLENGATGRKQQMARF